MPTLGVEEPTPVEEKELEDVTGEGAGANGDAQAPRVSSDSSGKPEDGQSVLVEKNVDGSSKDKTTDEPSSAELEKAEKRYQGELDTIWRDLSMHACSRQIFRTDSRRS